MKKNIIIRIDKNNGEQEKCTEDYLHKAIKGYYDNSEEIIKDFLNGKIKNIQTSFAIYKLKK